VTPGSEDEGWSTEFRSRNGSTRAPSGDGVQRLIVVSYILAVAMPPLGLILGIGLALRMRTNRSRHAAWIILVSIFAGIVWIAIIASGGLTATNNSY
jgi:hypothetical protein